MQFITLIKVSRYIVTPITTDVCNSAICAHSELIFGVVVAESRP